MVSESAMIIENADAAYGIAREFNSIDGKVYLSIKELKSRGDKNAMTSTFKYFAHPFVDGNGMRLMEDYGLDEEYSVDSVTNSMGIEEDMDAEPQEPVRGKRNKKVHNRKTVSLKEEFVED